MNMPEGKKGPEGEEHAFLGGFSWRRKAESLYRTGGGQYFLLRSLSTRKRPLWTDEEPEAPLVSDAEAVIIPLKGEKAARKWAECLSVGRYREIFPDVEEA